MKSGKIFAIQGQGSFVDELVLSATLPPAEVKRLHRMTNAGAMRRLKPGIYVNGGLDDEEVALVVQRNWQRVAGAIVPGGVVSHISAMTKGVVGVAPIKSDTLRLIGCG